MRPGRNLNTWGGLSVCLSVVTQEVLLVVGGVCVNVQHLDNVSFISSNRLLSRVGSLHFPSMETEFSPFFTSRQT